ncbi:MAG: hypothetical protein ACUVUR_05415 [bacterium]
MRHASSGVRSDRCKKEVTIPERFRLESHRSIEISFNRLSPRIGCGLMLNSLPRFHSLEPLFAVMNNYGYEKVHADKPAQKTLAITPLLKQFYDSAFNNKSPLQQNFRNTYGNQEVYLAFDPAIKTAWFVSEPQNKIALANYFRDATSLQLKADGIALVGSTTRLSPVGWQNLHDLLSDKFMSRLGRVERIEITSLLTGVRWRPPVLGLGVMMLNTKEFKEVQVTVDAAIKGHANGEIHL